MPKTLPNVGQSALTRRQIEMLEAVYHRGDPWMKKFGPKERPDFYPIGTRGHAGGAASRMLEELQRRHLITTQSIPSLLTVKGLEALKRDKVAMLAITPLELDSRITKRTQIEADEKRTADGVRAEREANAAKREAESRKTRLAKLHELLDGLDGPVFSTMGDDQLLDLAGKISDIETVY